MVNIFKHHQLIWIFIGTILLFSCDLIDERVCTLEFRTIGMAVETPEGDPVVFDEFTIRNSRTGKKIDLCDSDSSTCGESNIHGAPEFGIYTIFHDGVRSEIFGPAMAVIAEGRKGDQIFERVFAVGDDGCHIFLIAGETQAVWDDFKG